ncbi:exported hypothetical protein [Mesorhizobium plurifarium]|uniref:Uncharacterized protein n=1 Tax=Mesorhizobium plurifarium TaxID=69974 RepID=A0A0K2VMP5_MESPL|nr:exported hypothetical protein [Mesorhizobium plurifarium]
MRRSTIVALFASATIVAVSLVGYAGAQTKSTSSELVGFLEELAPFVGSSKAGIEYRDAKLRGVDTPEQASANADAVDDLQATAASKVLSATGGTMGTVLGVANAGAASVLMPAAKSERAAIDAHNQLIERAMTVRNGDEAMQLQKDSDALIAANAQFEPDTGNVWDTAKRFAGLVGTKADNAANAFLELTLENINNAAKEAQQNKAVPDQPRPPLQANDETAAPNSVEPDSQGQEMAALPPSGDLWRVTQRTSGGGPETTSECAQMPWLTEDDWVDQLARTHGGGDSKSDYGIYKCEKLTAEAGDPNQPNVKIFNHLCHWNGRAVFNSTWVNESFDIQTRLAIGHPTDNVVLVLVQQTSSNPNLSPSNELTIQYTRCQ